MATQELIEYIKRQLSHGHNVTIIREHLIKHNYPETIADEALHKAAEEFGATIKHHTFPFKKIAYAFAALLIIVGIGFGIFQMFGEKDLAGAATEAEPSIVIETHAPEQVQEQPQELPEVVIPEEPVEEIQETPQEQEAEEVVEETPVEEVQEPVQEVAGCTSDNDCNSAYVCYNHACEIDNDRDFLSDAEEAIYETDPLLQDTDGDGYFDNREIDDETDPLDPASPGYTSCINSNDCAEGEACSPAAICIACYDPDEQNYKRKGTSSGVHYVSGKTMMAQDVCTETGKLLEFFCTTDNYLYYKEINCEQTLGEGFYCSAGKCTT